MFANDKIAPQEEGPIQAGLPTETPLTGRGMHIGNRRQFALATTDFKEGISSIHVWPKLAWLEIKQCCRRSVLGPFWLTISTGALIGGMGPLYGHSRVIELEHAVMGQCA